jgi:hypothetical protein
MTRLRACALFLCIVTCVPIHAESKSSELKPGTTASFLKLCFDLWKRTEYGWNSKQSEKAAWIIRDRDGKIRWMEWDSAPEHRAATWKYEVPEGVIALIHTHPALTDPKPSRQDVRVAKQIKASVYTLSAFGIWRAAPNGTITQEAGQDWHRPLQTKK